jgi:YidC/Oxa1 family membrane protein insertase
MWVSQRMTPMTSVDPMQKRMMELMPILFTFIMAQFAVGLLVYWVWSNLLTMLQQYAIMRRLKVENVVDTTIAKITAHLTKKTAA